MITSTVLRTGSALLAFVALTGCGASDDGSKSKDGSPSTSAAAAPTGPEAILQDGEPLAPGTELALGDIVTVAAQESYGDEGDFTATVNLGVNEIKEAPASDFDVLTDAESYAGSVPVYVYSHLEIVEITGGDEHTGIEPGLRAWTADGEQAQQLILTIGLGADAGPLCAGGAPLQGNDAPLAAGSSTLHCTIFVVPEGQAIEKVTYGNTLLAEDETYDDDPVAWVV